MELKLSLSIASQADINRLLREIGALDDYFIAARTKSKDDNSLLPRITRLLTLLASDNQINLAVESQRTELKAKLQNVLKTAPVLHISFAADPDPRLTDAILDWLRANIHPYTLLVIGLQPSIAAGCVLRTPNKIFDMSLRDHLKGQEKYLAELIKESANAAKR